MRVQMESILFVTRLSYVYVGDGNNHKCLANSEMSSSDRLELANRLGLST